MQYFIKLIIKYKFYINLFVNYFLSLFRKIELVKIHYLEIAFLIENLSNHEVITNLMLRCYFLIGIYQSLLTYLKHLHKTILTCLFSVCKLMSIYILVNFFFINWN